MAATNIQMDIRGLPFSEPGQYRVQLFAAGEFLMDRLLRVVAVEAKPEGQTANQAIGIKDSKGNK